MDQHTLRVLEFDKIRLFLTSCAASPGGKRMCEQLTPEKNQRTVTRLLAETTEMRREIEENGLLPLSGINDIRAAVKQACIRNAYLEPEHLVSIKNTLETAAILQRYCGGLAETRPLLFEVATNITGHPDIAEQIRRSISSQGDILDEASPELADIRRRLKKLRLSIMKALEQHITDDITSYAVQDEFITLRNNRYVIPVRSDSKSVIPGVVHDQSRSKATFFVEPLAVVNLNNEMQMLRKEEYYEEIRILTALTQMVASRAETITADLELLEHIDLIHARALFSKSLSAWAPKVNADGIIELYDCRHPILLAEFIEDEPVEEAVEELEPTGHWEFTRDGVVPVDLVKDSTISTLIITGANAGGKTVAMKTLGLFVLMAQAGLHIPTRPGGTIALYESVFADIGDEQNIEASLSTFSAHMSQIKTIANAAAPTSLVLLDELGSGTDPSSGGALAVAILDFLREKGCCTAITTHYNILKTYAYSNSDVQNVSVEFDPDTHRPTYRLSYGVPGISNALAIAENIGIPKAILDNAAGHLDQTDKQVGELVLGLEKTQQELSKLRSALKQANSLARNHRQAAEKLMETMRGRRENLVKKFAEDARRLLRQSEDTLTSIIKEQKRRRIVRPDNGQPQEQDSKDAFGKVKKTLLDAFPGTRKSPVPVSHLEPGQTVRVFHLQKTGTVVSADNRLRKAEIAVGAMRVKAGFDELEPANRQPRTPKFKPVAQKQPQPTSVQEKRVNIIGMRVDDALPVVDKAIDDALLQGADILEIVHGRGTGRLMQAVHDYLKGNTCVQRFGSGEDGKGGAGITIVHIK